jgi:hypothetical protein
VNQGKGHAERIGNGSCALCTTSVGRDNDGLLVVGDVELDVLAEEVAAVKVVDGDVEEALVLRIWRLVSELSSSPLLCILRTVKIHSNNVVGARTRQKVCDQRAGLGYPLSVPDLGLKGWRLCSGLLRVAVGAIGGRRTRLAGEVGLVRLIRLVRLVCVDALNAILLLNGAWRVRWTAIALIQLHSTELLVQRHRAIRRTIG